MSAPKTITCKRCFAEIHRHEFRKHLFICKGLPALAPAQRVCTVCQEIKLVDEFPPDRKSLPTYTCRACVNGRTMEWNRRKSLGEKPITPFRERPGKRKVRPCPWCGDQFMARDILRHSARCPKRTYPLNSRWSKMTCRWCGETVVYHGFQKHTRVCLGLSGMSESEKVCSFCQRILPIDEFGKVRRGRLYNSCRDCGYDLCAKQLYGIGLAEHTELCAKQNGRCALCGEIPAPQKKRKRLLVIDHNHATKKVRGALCTGCNTGLGGFCDDITKLEKAIAYIRLHSQSPVMS